MSTIQPAEIDPKSLQQNSTLSTIFTLTNCMIGGTMLLLPTLTLQAGMVTTVFVMVITGSVSYATCVIFCKHMKESEMDIQHTIKRILGMGWYYFFVVTCSIYKFFVCQLYYFLIIEMIYFEIVFLLRQFGVDKSKYVDPKDKNEFTFKVFSEQWVLVVTFLPFLGALQYRNLKKLVKLTEFGVYPIYAFLIFLFYCLFTNLSNISDGENTIEAWTWDIGNLGGTCSMAFTIHTSFGNIIKCNKNQQNNSRDLGISYAVGGLIYIFISIVGALGVVGRLGPNNDDLPSKIIDFFGEKNWAPFIVSMLYLLMLMSVLPVFWDVTKRRFIPLFNKGKEQLSDMKTLILNIFFVLSGVGIKSIPGITPDQITNFNGSLNCFFIVYLIPITMHFTCYTGPNKILRKIQRKISRVTRTEALPPDPEYTPVRKVSHFDSLQKPILEYAKSHKVSQSQISVDETDTDCRQSRIESCGNHEVVQLSTQQLIWRFIFYGIIGLIGLAILIYGMYTFGKDIADGK